MNNVRTAITGLAMITVIANAHPAAAEKTENDPERVEWFRDQALGMFIHWSVDSQLGSVISHSLVGASDDYVRRYFAELPPSFDPQRFQPERWAALARLAGMKYVVFTAKHHNGFCMWDTQTTDFNVMKTRYGKDIVAQVLDAFRREGITVGLYFSPDDFHFLHKQGKTISRFRPGVLPTQNPALMEHDKAQLKELLTRYGAIDLLFIDGPHDGRRDEGLKEYCWSLQPDLLITRGALPTPEQTIPGRPLKGCWESCFTLGTQWQFKPTNEQYKSGGELIRMLIETRAKGGNLLLNVGPKPDGTIPPEQENRIRELALWNFINRQAVYEVRPLSQTNQGRIWMTQSRDGDSLFAIVGGDPESGEVWEYGARKTITLSGIRTTNGTQVDVLGQNSKVLEYKPDVDPSVKWHQDDAGLHISVMRAQRIYNDRKWPNPIVIRIRQAEWSSE